MLKFKKEKTNDMKKKIRNFICNAILCIAFNALWIWIFYTMFIEYTNP